MRIIETSFWAHAASRTSYSATTARGIPGRPLRTS